MRLIRALRDCKQRSLTVSKKAPTVSKKSSPTFNKLYAIPVLEFPYVFSFTHSRILQGLCFAPVHSGAALVQNSGPEKGVITKGVFSVAESLESLKSLDSLESLENGRILLCFPLSGGSLETLESLNSLEPLENGLF